MKKLIMSCFGAVAFTVLVPSAALAYVGPGTGLSTIGALFALLGGIVVAVLGFIWYPIKKLFFKKKPGKNNKPPEKEK